MPESEQNTLPVPVSDIPSYNDIPIPDNPADAETDTHSETVSEDTAEEIYESNPVRRKIPLGVFLKKSAIFLLSAVSILVFGITAVSILADNPVGSHFLTRLMLGEFFGGIGNVHSVPVTDAGYRSVQPDSSASTPGLSPLDALTSPDSDIPESVQKSLSAGTLALSNETPYDPNMNEILAMERTIPPLSELYAAYGEDAPVVLILHTHGTEAFAECAADDYRSTDTAKNIVSAGAVIAEKLEEKGIRTLHCTAMFDEEDFTMAYYNASLEIRRTLEEYPSISYILDVHRDSIETDGVYIAPAAQTEDGTTAQMMFVIGTDYGGSGHTTWKNNLSLAARLHTALNKNTPQLMRDINLRSASFNEQYSDGSLLLEIGACASTLEEVHHSAELFADALADEIIGQ